MIQEQKTITGSGTYITEWGYNSADMVAWMKYPEGNTGAVGEQVNFAYYPQMALKRVVGVGTATYLDEAAYDEMGRMVTRKLGSRLPETTYTYYPWAIDANAEGYQQGGRLKNTITGSLQNLSYAYDPNGNILSITDGRGGGDAPLTFGYDAANRLDWMNKGGQLQDNPDYDATTGNLIQKGQSNPQPGNPAIALGYIDNSLSNLDNTKPHAVKSMGGNQYGYDANGNMIKRLIGGVTYTLTYDAENRLVGYAGGSITASFVYDGDGKRVKGTVNGVTTTYVGNYYEVQGTTTRKYYFAGTQRIAVNENGVLYYFLSDHLGSTAIAVEEDGDFHGELRYSAWGETREEIGETPTSRRFTGQAQEELLRIYFFEARWFDPQLGRFLSPDSVVPDPYNSLDWDRYSYVRNNSINFNDPSGHMCSDPEDPTPTCESGNSHPLKKGSDWRKLILQKFGITMLDDTGKWDQLNLYIVYRGLSKINSLLDVKKYVGGSKFLFKTTSDGTYHGFTEGMQITFYTNDNIATQNIYHEFGHLLNNGLDNALVSALGNKVIYSDTGEYLFGGYNQGNINTGILKAISLVDSARSKLVAAMQHPSKDPSEQWADLFANVCADNISNSSNGQEVFQWFDDTYLPILEGRATRRP